MENMKRICTSCGSHQLAGPYRTDSWLKYGAFGSIAEESYVCLDCGHVENFCAGSSLDTVRRRAMKKQEKENRKKYESM